ncbi:MAG: DJ-1/PfpI family protein [Rhodothermaceae bacterium]
MRLLKKNKIGFILTPGFRAADVVGLYPILGGAIRNKVFLVAEKETCILGRSNFQVCADTNFENCPKLDVLVVGESLDSSYDNSKLTDFVKRKAREAKYVIGISNGVTLLAKAGLLKGKRATSDRSNLEKMREFGAIPVNENKPVVDGKFYTSGPSTGAIESAFKVFSEISGEKIARLWELTQEYNPHKRFSSVPYSKEIVEKLVEKKKSLKIAVLSPPHMFVPDAMGAVDVLGSIPGAEVHYVWKKKGKANGLLSPSIYSDTAFEECPQMDIIIVGAVQPGVSADEETIRFLKKQEKNATAILGICAGVFVIGGAGLLKGKNAASNFHMTNLVSCVGATPSRKEVEIDGKIFTAGPIIGSYEAALIVVSNIYGKEVAAWIENEILEYSPNPVFGVGSPELAGKMLVALSKLFIIPGNPIYRRAAKSGYKKSQKM